jgi:uncharacterized OsmC-like protein
MGVPDKRWSISALSKEGAGLSYAKDGQPLALGAAGPAEISPVEYLLIAVASCFALSCRSVVAARGLPRGAFEVRVTGAKALSPPSRLDRIELSVAFGSDVDGALARAIAEDAEKLCTVTNTILSTPRVIVTAELT